MLGTILEIALQLLTFAVNKWGGSKTATAAAVENLVNVAHEDGLISAHSKAALLKK